jgi:hypothetical protein
MSQLGRYAQTGIQLSSCRRGFSPFAQMRRCKAFTPLSLQRPFPGQGWEKRAEEAASAETIVQQMEHGRAELEQQTLSIVVECRVVDERGISCRERRGRRECATCLIESRSR